jgi:ribosomal protein S18 acetylase RimI-like enzyme
MQAVTRRARPDDLDALVPLMIAFNAVEQVAWDPPASLPALRHLLASDEAGAILVAERDHQLAGYAVVTWGFDLEFAGRDAFLTEIFVRPVHRRGGVACSLLDGVIAAARAAGAAALHLMVYPGNAPAIALYERAGFARIPRVAMTRSLR